MTSIKTKLLRTTSLATAAGVLALTAASPAHAAIVNSVTNIQATAMGSACRISWDENITANVDDGGGIDFYAISIPNVTPTFTQVANTGSTTTFSQFLDVTVPLATARYAKYIQHQDVASGSSPIVSQTLIPDSQLVAAGGACLNLRVNNEPNADAGANQNTSQFATVSLSGTASDLENDPLTFQWSQTAGAAVTLSGATTLTPSFAAPVKTSAVQTLSFSLAVNDGADTSTDSVDVSVAANVGPTADAGPDDTVGGGTIGTLDGSGSSDGDGDPITYSWTQTAGPSVTLSGANTANPTFTAPVATTVNQTLVFELIVNDGLVSSAADSVTITVPNNAPPVVDAGADATALPGATVTLNGAATDLENDPLTYQWTQVAGPSVTLGGPTTLTPSFTAPPKTNAAQMLIFSLVANDGNSSSAADTVTITIPANAVPVFSSTSGSGGVNGGAPFTFDASGLASDPDGDPLSFQWTQTAGPGATLTGANTPILAFTAPPKSPVAQTMTFELVANDGLASSLPFTFTVTIAANQDPVANAGLDATVNGGSTVALDGGGSIDSDGDPLTYAWVQTGGPSVTLSDAASAAPTFTAPQALSTAQILTFELTVNDGFTTSPADSVTITIPDNAAPTVDAGPDATATGGATVTLSGSATDFENDPLTYQWTQTAGPGVTLSGSTTLNPTFVAPAKTAAAQVLTFQLIANDGNSNSSPDTVDITIPANVGPTANAGNDVTFPGGSQVFLEGFGTDPDNDPLTLQWTQISGPSVTLNDAATQNPNFIAPAKTANVQVLTFSLEVSDGIATSPPDTVDVTIPANVGPTADAGADANVGGGAQVTLDGSGSTDGDGDPLTYAWVQTGGPSVALSDAASAAPTFTAPQAVSTVQTLTFELTVSDGFTTSPVDSVAVTIAANAPPVADAGADQGPINSGDSVTLDGSGSSDPDNDSLTYQWTQISGSAVTLSNPASASPTFIAPNVQGLQDVEFQLVVNDGTVNSAPDTVVISVRGVGTVTIIQRVVGRDASFAFTSDIAALNGTISTSGGTGQQTATGVAAGGYTITVADLSAAGFAVTEISCNDSDSVVNLASRTVSLALSPNEDLVCTFVSANSRDAAARAINDFLTGRNALIMAMQPDLQRRLDRLNGGGGAGGNAVAYGVPIPGSGSLPFSMALGSGQAAVSTSLATAVRALGDKDRGPKPFDIWTEAQFADTRLGTQEGSFRIIHIGADYLVGDDILIGVLGQFDDFNDQGSLDIGEAEGNGWMVGPYAMARLAPGLFGEVRAAWGGSDNLVSPLGSYIDSFRTERSFYSGSLIGQFDLGDQTLVRPEVTLRYLNEKTNEYVDSLNITIPSQTVSQGDISFRPRVQHRIDLNGGWVLRPFTEFEGIYTFGTNQNAVLDNGLRGRVEGGVDLFGKGSFRSSLSVFHDGIGAGNFRSTGVHLAVSFGF